MTYDFNLDYCHCANEIFAKIWIFEKWMKVRNKIICLCFSLLFSLAYIRRGISNYKILTFNMYGCNICASLWSIINWQMSNFTAHIAAQKKNCNVINLHICHIHICTWCVYTFALKLKLRLTQLHKF